MKNFLLLTLTCSCFTNAFSQDNYFRFDDGRSVYFRSLSYGTGGRALVHDTNNTLVLNYGNDFTGGIRIGSALSVDGSLNTGKMFLRAVDSAAGLSQSYLQFSAHNLFIGTPVGSYAHNYINFRPGGSTQGLLYSLLNMYIATGENTYEKKVMIHTQGNSFFNGGNVGIGTETPQAKLDVNGGIGTKLLNVNNLTGNTLTSVLSRLPEGNDEGEGTFLGVRSHSSSPPYTKSFGLEHKFYGQLNSCINFYRGGSKLGGWIGIGVYDGTEIAKFNQEGLSVGGIIRAREIKVEVSAGADYVFNNDYKLKPLSEVKTFIEENKHLPEIPSEKEMQKDGLSINEFQMKLLQKIEELTLYVIEQDKTIKGQGDLLMKQSKLIEKLEDRLDRNNDSEN